MTDAHIHLSFATTESVEDHLNKSQAIGIGRHLMAGYNAEDWSKQIQLKTLFPKQIFTCFGVHPWFVKDLPAKAFEAQLSKLSVLAPTADLIGETGLDGFQIKSSEQQAIEELSFRKHVALAIENKKPLILHSVKEAERSLKILKSFAKKYSGIMHGFSGPPSIALEYIKMGFFISIGPGLLHPKFKNLLECAQTLPLESLVFESDQPDQKNQSLDPLLLNKVLGRFYTLRPETPAQINEQTEKNVDSLFIP